MTRTRRAACAGRFYPAEAEELRRTVEGLLRLVDAERGGDGPDPPPSAIIAPHAGYRFSGPVAASAYALLRPLHGRCPRVVLLGPAHHVPFAGLAVPSVEQFETPLGLVPLDQDALRILTELPQVTVRDDAHAPEHSLEVHLPFLQVVLGSFRLAPILVGDATGGEVAEALETVWKEPGTIVVASSDLSHHRPADVARRLDAETAHRIEQRRGEDVDPERACGHRVIAGLLHVARRRSLAVRTVDLRNSADTAGGPERVVGYGAFAVAVTASR